MEIMERFKSGINTASDSFYILWKHKSLFFYFGIITIIKIIFSVCATNYFFHIDTPITQFLSDSMLFQLSLIPLSTFAQVALAHHIAHIFNDLNATIQESLHTTLRKWQPILAWSGITFLANILFSQLNNMGYIYPIEMSLGMLGIIWSLLTIFVPISIALEKITLIEHIRHSIIVMRNYLLKLLGGLLWIGIIFLLLIIPLSSTWLITLFVPGLYHNMIFIQTMSNLIPWIISTASTIFKTILYLQYKKGIEELQQLQYPHM